MGSVGPCAAAWTSEVHINLHNAAAMTMDLRRESENMADTALQRGSVSSTARAGAGAAARPYIYCLTPRWGSMIVSFSEHLCGIEWDNSGGFRDTRLKVLIYAIGTTEVVSKRQSAGRTAGHGPVSKQ